jgi:dihydrofolate reductase
MKAILHADKEWGIGKDNKLMFSLPLDMKFFRTTTLGNVVVMGGNTLKSFPNGNPLKGRVNIVLSRSIPPRDDCIVVASKEELFNELKKYDSDKIYVIGGSSIYKMLLDYCDEVLVTKVDAVGGADAFFENLDENENFEKVASSEKMETNGYYVTFVTYKNKNVKKFN